MRIPLNKIQSRITTASQVKHNTTSHLAPRVPRNFTPPKIETEDEGIQAFHKYDWYFNWMQRYMNRVNDVYLTPCAATKPIHSSTFHRKIFQKFFAEYGGDSELLIVSEPVVLIRYQDLYNHEKVFCYEFLPKNLGQEARELFVKRLRTLLAGKSITGCLPRHHEFLVNDAIGDNWGNHWNGNMFQMIKRASSFQSVFNIGKTNKRIG